MLQGGVAVQMLLDARGPVFGGKACHGSHLAASGSLGQAIVARLVPPCPAERIHAEFVPEIDKAKDALAGVGHAFRVGVLDDPAVDDGEEALDQVEPRRVDGREHKMEAIPMMLGEFGPTFARPGFVRAEVVPDDLDFADWIQRGDFLQELDSGLGRAVLDHCDDGVAGGNLKCRRRAAGSVANILVFFMHYRMGTNFRRMFATQGLNRHFVDAVDAEHLGTSR